MLRTHDAGSPVQAATNGPRASSREVAGGVEGSGAGRPRGVTPRGPPSKPSTRTRKAGGIGPRNGTVATPSRSATSVHRRPTPPSRAYETVGEYDASSTVGRARSTTAPAPSSSSGPASTATGTTSSTNVTRSRTSPVASRSVAVAPRGPVHIRTRVPLAPLASAVDAMTTRRPATSSA